jgi:hypothetical protein
LANGTPQPIDKDTPFAGERGWIHIGANARMHRLYGLRGWALAFVVFHTLALINDLRIVLAVFGFNPSDPIAGEFSFRELAANQQMFFAGYHAVIDSFYLLLLLALYYRMHYFIRVYEVFSIVFLAMRIPKWALAFEASAQPTDRILALLIATDIIACGRVFAWLLYVRMSTRIHVTTRNEVRNTDPFLLQFSKESSLQEGPASQTKE